MQMTCPKCHGEMRVYERSGVTVDQCTECRGIFLDRGELEKLFEAESSWNSRQAAPSRPQPGAHAPQPGAYTPPPPPPPAAPGYPAPGVQHYGPGYPQPGYGQPGYGQPAYGHHGHYRQHGHYRRRKGFLQDLFD
jgi:Zn-finger nucleic acid-binding protein